MRHTWIILVVFLARPFTVSPLNASLAQLDPSRLLLSQEVSAWVSVTDDSGSPVRGLTAEAFSLAVSADGKLFQPVSPISGFQGDAGASGGLTFLLLVDDSGSMYDTMGGTPTSDEALMRITRAREAVRSFLDSMTNPSDRVGLATFNTWLRVLVPPTSARDEVRGMLDRIARPSRDDAYTELFAGLRGVSRDFGGLAGRKAIIVLSDGENFPYTTGTGRSHPVFGSTIATAGHAILACQQAGVTVYGISFGPQKEKALGSIAVQTGGVLFDAADQSELTGAYQAIRRQVEAEYRLTWRSPTTPAERMYVRVSVTQGAGNASAERFYFSSTVFGLPLDRLSAALLVSLVAAAGLLFLLSILKLERKPGPARLEVLQTRGGHPSTRIMPLGGGSTVIGSARDADLTIVGAPRMRDTHATILHDSKGGGYTVVGGGEITVNNQPVKTRKLEPGDVIDVGGATIVFDAEAVETGRKGKPNERQRHHGPRR